MKQKTFILIAAAVATLGIAACEREEEPVGSPSGGGNTIPVVDTIPEPELTNPLVGTVWVSHLSLSSQWFTSEYEERITFHTDSTGEWYRSVHNSFPIGGDTTIGFTYTFDRANKMGYIIGDWFGDGSWFFTYTDNPPEIDVPESGFPPFHPYEQ